MLAGCAALPDGGDVEGDIKKYAYQNKPRLEALSSLVPAGNPYDPGLMALPFTVGSGGAVIASSDFPWRIPAGCRRAYRQWLANHPARVADQAAFLRSGDCNERPKDIFVGAAITGGGNKSAVFATEVLFELQRYGIAKDIDVLSSVSGGSLAAVLYALSCDPGHESCADGNRDGWKRPVWTYKEASEHITTGYLWPFAIKRVVSSLLLVNPRTFHGSDDDLASTLGDRLLKQGGSDLTFADLNPARPNLVLNATNMTRNRADFDQRSDISYDAKRPLSDDDALHFSYTQQYFWRLGSDLDRFPLKYAVAASAGFPLLIDAFSLRHYKLDELQAMQGAPQKTKPTYVSLMDGGIHDNFGVTELLWFVQCQSGQNARRAQWTADIYRRECGTAGKPAAPPKATLAIGINSSLLRSTGRNETVPKQRSWDTYVSPIRLSGTAASVDMLMAASGEMRKMQLRSVLEVLNDGGKNSQEARQPLRRQRTQSVRRHRHRGPALHSLQDRTARFAADQLGQRRLEDEPLRTVRGRPEVEPRAQPPPAGGRPQLLRNRHDLSWPRGAGRQDRADLHRGRRPRQPAHAGQSMAIRSSARRADQLRARSAICMVTALCSALVGRRPPVEPVPAKSQARREAERRRRGSLRPSAAITQAHARRQGGL